MSRLFQITDVLLAEVMPDGSVRWWESPPVPFDDRETGNGYYNWIRQEARRGRKPLPFDDEWDEDDPSFEDATRTIEGD